MRLRQHRAPLRQRRCTPLRQRFAVELHGAAMRDALAGHQLEQRRFAGTARAEDSDPFTGLQRQVEGAEAATGQPRDRRCQRQQGIHA
jgi:hypothetical protein